MSVHMYQHVDTIQGESLHANILRTLSGKSFVVEIWQDTGRRSRMDSRRKRSLDAARREAHRLFKFWADAQ
jgi:hypothetical protein